MGIQIQGCDVSHWQTMSEIITISNDKSLKFAIIKATEGGTYIDDQAGTYFCTLQSNKIIGFYHYARPENNDYKKEAEHFVKTIEKIAGTNNYFMALDWEGKALNYPPSWALSWLSYVEEMTGTKPLLYTGYNYLTNHKESLKAIVEHDFGLWCARYNSYLGNVEPWVSAAIWQYASLPYDKDIFYGTEEQLKKFCRQDKTCIPGTEELACYFDCGDLDRCPIARFINGLE